MPEESPAEVMLMQICEVSTLVHEFLAQPHRLEMDVRGSGRPLIYFPDFEIKADRRLVDLLLEKRAFGLAALDWSPAPLRGGDFALIVAEVKRPGDQRLSDPEYARKLQLAREVYESVGFHFVLIEESSDLACVDGRALRRIVYDAMVKTDKLDAALALEFIGSKGGVADLAELQGILGEGLVGIAKDSRNDNRYATPTAAV
jgi:hypothetical protein